ANATEDESKLWHRRLGHVNFKNINKLVKGHLVRGLPSKVFMNDHTCVACKKGYLLGYSTSSKAFRVYNKRTKRVEENMHIDFLEDQPNVAGSGPDWMFDCDFLTNYNETYIPVSVENHVNMVCRTRISIEDVVQAAQEKPFENSPKDSDVQDSEDVAEKEEQHTLTEAEKVLKDDLERMIAQEIAAKAIYDATRQTFEEEELRATQATSINKHNTGRISVGTSNSPLVSTANTPYASAVSTPTSLLNEDDSNVFQMMAYSSKSWEILNLQFKQEERFQKDSSVQKLWEEGIDYDEVFAPVAMIEAIMLFLGFCFFNGISSYQRDGKSAFLVGTIKEEVDDHQPPGFVGFYMSSMGKAHILYGITGDETKQSDGLDGSLRLRAIYGAELVSAASLVNTARPTLSTARLSLCCSKVLHDGIDDWISSQTVNDVKQINATVDSKAVVVTEASIRSSLPFNDVDGTACLTNEAEGEGSGEPTEPQPTPSPTQPSTGDQTPKTSPSHATTQDSRDSLEETNGNEGDQVQTPHDSPLSGGHTSDRAEGALNLQELSVLCTNLSNRVLALESIKDAQAAEISALKIRIKRLEKKCKPSISHHRAWLKSVQRLSMKKRFGKKESVSKQGRKKSKPESTLDDSTVFDDQDADHGMEYIDTKEDVDKGEESVIWGGF
ncbi:copia protein, partial [Tanacetum coccineum]